MQFEFCIFLFLELFGGLLSCFGPCDYFCFNSNIEMEQREETDFPPNKQPPPQSEASSPAPADFPARKLVRQLDFTGFSGGPAASSAEQPQLVQPRQPAAQQPQLAKTSQPPQMLFMTMQQPPQPAVPSAQHSIRSLL